MPQVITVTSSPSAAPYPVSTAIVPPGRGRTGHDQPVGLAGGGAVDVDGEGAPGDQREVAGDVRVPGPDRPGSMRPVPFTTTPVTAGLDGADPSSTPPETVASRWWRACWWRREGSSSAGLRVAGGSEGARPTGPTSTMPVLASAPTVSSLPPRTVSEPEFAVRPERPFVPAAFWNWALTAVQDDHAWLVVTAPGSRSTPGEIRGTCLWSASFPTAPGTRR